MGEVVHRLMTKNESWFFSKGELLAMHVMGEQLPSYAILDSTVTQNSCWCWIPYVHRYLVESYQLWRKSSSSSYSNLNSTLTIPLSLQLLILRQALWTVAAFWSRVIFPLNTDVTFRSQGCMYLAAKKQSTGWGDRSVSWLVRFDR